jgi:hypothetical protein
MKTLAIAALVLGSASAGAPAAVFKHVDQRTHEVSYANFLPPGWPARELTLPRSPEPRRTRHSSSSPMDDSPPARPERLLGADTFPRIDPEQQRKLDVDRRKILGDELMSVQAALQQAQSRSDAPDVINRHRADVEALLRELARVK